MFMVFKDFYIMNKTGGKSDNESTRYDVFADSKRVSNNTFSIFSTSSNFDSINKITDKMDQVCSGMSNIASAFLRLVSSNSESFDKVQVYNCVRMLLDKIAHARSDISNIIKGLQECMGNISLNETCANDPSKTRKTNETFDECITPMRDFLGTISSEFLNSFNLLVETTKDIYIEEYNKSYPDNPITATQFNQTIINETNFKNKFYDALTKSPIWFVVMNISMYTPMTEKRVNFIDPIISTKTNSVSNVNSSNPHNTDEIASLLSAYCGTGNSESELSNAIDTLSKLATQVSLIENNIVSGMYQYSIHDKRDNYFGEGFADIKGNLNQPGMQPGFSNKPRLAENASEIKNIDIISLIHQLHSEIARFVIEKTTCISTRNAVSTILNRDASITSVCQAFIKYILNAHEPVELTNFMTSDAKSYYQIILTKIKNDIKFNSKYKSYLPAIQYVLTCINLWFKESDQANIETENDSLGVSTVKSNTCTENIARYFNPRNEKEKIQLVVHLIDALNVLVIKPYVEQTGTLITAFCIINDFKTTDDKLIYRKSGDYLETVNSSECPGYTPVESGAVSTQEGRVPTSMSSMVSSPAPQTIESDTLNTIRNATRNMPPETDVISPNGSATSVNTSFSTIKIPFTFVFDRCDLSKIPNWINLSKEIEKKSVCMITFGYSGSGKSVTSLGKYNAQNSKFNQQGILQYCLQTLKLPFYVEVLEIYGRALPTYESFNLNANDGIIKSISWIKQYTMHKSLKGDSNGNQRGFYSENDDMSDKYDEDSFDYITDESVPGALIKTPDKIKEYFKNRLTVDHIKKNMHYVDKEEVQSVLTRFSSMLVDPVEMKRRKLRTIFFTPNNPDSSRSTLIYTFSFEVSEGKFHHLTIIDFPGKEDPNSTYIYDLPRSMDGFEDSVMANYPDMYDKPMINLYMKKFTNHISNHDTMLNLLILNPMILIGMNKLMNIVIVNEMNKYLKNKNVSGSIINELIKSVGDYVIFQNIKIRDLFKTGVYHNNLESFPQLLDWTVSKDKEKHIDNRSNLEKEPAEKQKAMNSNDITAQVIYSALLPSQKLAEYTNIIRQIYISVIFLKFLESPHFNNNDIIVLLLKAINKVLFPTQEQFPYLDSNHYGMKNFFNVNSKEEAKYITYRLNNIFEAYFINELVALLVRDMSISVSDRINPNKINDKDTEYQGDKLHLIDSSYYSMKRQLSRGIFRQNISEDKMKDLYGINAEKLVGEDIYNFNPIWSETSWDSLDDKSKKFPKIYRIESYIEIDYLPRTPGSLQDEKSKKMREQLEKEKKQLYDYSKCISTKDKNKIFNLLRIAPETSTDSLSFYLLYVVSSVQSNQKCYPANRLLESLIQQLNCLVKQDCQN